MISDNICLFCNNPLGNHSPGCPALKAFIREVEKAKTLSVISVAEGYRLKDKLTGLFYDSQAMSRKSPIGRLYSKRGIVSLLSYNFQYFRHPHSQWEILEYDVAEEIELIDKMGLGEWTRFKQLVRSKEKK